MTQPRILGDSTADARSRDLVKAEELQVPSVCVEGLPPR